MYTENNLLLKLTLSLLLFLSVAFADVTYNRDNFIFHWLHVGYFGFFLTGN